MSVLYQTTPHIEVELSRSAYDSGEDEYSSDTSERENNMSVVKKGNIFSNENYTRDNIEIEIIEDDHERVSIWDTICWKVPVEETQYVQQNDYDDEDTHCNPPCIIQNVLVGVCLTIIAIIVIVTINMSHGAPPMMYYPNIQTAIPSIIVPTKPYRPSILQYRTFLYEE